MNGKSDESQMRNATKQSRRRFKIDYPLNDRHILKQLWEKISISNYDFLHFPFDKEKMIWSRIMGRISIIQRCRLWLDSKDLKGCNDAKFQFSLIFNFKDCQF